MEQTNEQEKEYLEIKSWGTNWNYMNRMKEEKRKQSSAQEIIDSCN